MKSFIVIPKEIKDELPILKEEKVNNNTTKIKFDYSNIDEYYPIELKQRQTIGSKILDKFYRSKDACLENAVKRARFEQSMIGIFLNKHFKTSKYC